MLDLKLEHLYEIPRTRLKLRGDNLQVLHHLHLKYRERKPHFYLGEKTLIQRDITLLKGATYHFFRIHWKDRPIRRTTNHDVHRTYVFLIIENGGGPTKSESIQIYLFVSINSTNVSLFKGNSPALVVRFHVLDGP